MAAQECFNRGEQEWIEKLGTDRQPDRRAGVGSGVMNVEGITVHNITGDEAYIQHEAVHVKQTALHVHAT